MVLNHRPNCVCIDGYVGDPFTSCNPAPPPRNKNLFLAHNGSHNSPSFVFYLNFTEKDPIPEDPCNPSPCGQNALCNHGICSCLLEYHGDPYFECRPECVLNSDCPRDKACRQNKCYDPCPGTCGSNALCEVINHVPMCTCPSGMEGNAFVQCRPLQSLYLLIEYLINVELTSKFKN